MATKVATGRVTKAKKEKGAKKSNIINPWLNFLAEYRSLNDPIPRPPKGSNWLAPLMRDAGEAYRALSDDMKQKYKVPLDQFKPAGKGGKEKDAGKMDTGEEEADAQSGASPGVPAKETKKGRKK